MGTIPKLLIIGIIVWIVLTIIDPNIAEGARSMVTPHAVMRLVIVGIIAGIVSAVYLRRN